MGFRARTRSSPSYNGLQRLIDRDLYERGVDLSEATLQRDECVTLWQLPIEPACAVLRLEAGARAEDPPSFSIAAFLMSLPDDGILPLYRRLLERNLDDLSFCSFGVTNDTVVLQGEWPAERVSEKRLSVLLEEMMEEVRSSTRYLVGEFGGTPLQESPL